MEPDGSSNRTDYRSGYHDHDRNRNRHDGYGSGSGLYDIAGADTDNRLSAGDTEQLRCLRWAVPYKYVSRLLDKRFGFLYIVLFIISSSTLSLYALSFASYFVSLFTGMSQIFIAAVILTVLFVVNIIGTKQAAVVNTIICAVMTGANSGFCGLWAA